jgi:hypothetical protein
VKKRRAVKSFKVFFFGVVFVNYFAFGSYGKSLQNIRAMKSFYVIASLSLALLVHAADLDEIESSRKTESDAIAEGISRVKSAKCRSDMNYTIDALSQRKPWAVASKIEF